MIEYLSRPSLLAVGILIVAGVLYCCLRPRQALPDLPWLNTCEGEFMTTLRARLRSALNYKQTVQHAYQRVGGFIQVSLESALLTVSVFQE